MSLTKQIEQAERLFDEIFKEKDSRICHIYNFTGDEIELSFYLKQFITSQITEACKKMAEEIMVEKEEKSKISLSWRNQ